MVGRPMKSGCLEPSCLMGVPGEEPAIGKVAHLVVPIVVVIAQSERSLVAVAFHGGDGGGFALRGVQSSKCVDEDQAPGPPRGGLVRLDRGPPSR
jgi:hypothetical protein